MKLTLISVILFQLLLFGCSLTGQGKASDNDAEYRLIVARVRAEHEYLTRLLALENKFSADDESNVRQLYRRFPKGTLIKSIEDELQKNDIQDEAIKVSFEKKSDGLRVMVRFVAEKPTRLETKYTFTFKEDNNGNLIETHYLIEHFHGGWSGEK